MKLKVKLWALLCLLIIAIVLACLAGCSGPQTNPDETLKRMSEGRK